MSRSTTTLGLSTTQKLWVERWLIGAVSEDVDVLLLPSLPRDWDVVLWEAQNKALDTLSQRYI